MHFSYLQGIRIISTATGDNQRIAIQFLAGAWDLSVLQSIQTNSGDHPGSYTVHTGPFPTANFPTNKHTPAKLSMHLVQIFHSYGEPQITCSNNVLNFEFQKLYLKTRECLKHSEMIHSSFTLLQSQILQYQISLKQLIHIQRICNEINILLTRKEKLFYTWWRLRSALPDGEHLSFKF
jgi:hypothetical protein